MGSVWKRLFKSNIKSRMFLSLSAALAVTIFIFGMMSYVWASNSVLSQTNRIYSDMTEQAQNAVETRLRELDTLALTLAKSDWVIKIACMQGGKIDYDRMDAFQLRDISSQFRNYTSLNTLIYRIGLLFYNKKTVITTTSAISMEWFFNHEYRYESMDFDAICKLVETNEDARFLDSSTIRYYDYSSACFTYIKRLPLVNNTDNVQLVVAIREDTVQGLLQKDKSDSLHSFLFDREGKLLTAVGAGDDLKDAMRDAAARRAFNGEVVTTGKDSYYAFFSQSKSSGWTYAVAVPRRVLLGQLNEVRVITLSACLALVATCIFLAWGLAERNYKPFKRLVDTVVGNKNTDSSGGNEIEVLEKAFRTMALNRVELEERMDKWSPYALHSFFIKLLNGLINMDEIPLIQKYMNIGDEYRCWTVAVFHNLEGAFPDSGLSQWSAGQEWTVYVVPLDRSRCALIINSRDAVGRTGVVEDLNRTLHLEHRREGFAIGIGRTHMFIGELANSYIDALVAAEYVSASNEAGGTTAFFEEINKGIRMKYSFPTEKEESLINHLHTGNIGKVNEILGQVLDENIAHMRVSPFAARCLFYNLVSIALKIMQEDESLDAGLLGEGDLLSSMPVNEMRAYVERLYERICAVMVEHKGNRALNGVRHMLRYVDERACTPDISLASVAEHFGITTAYLCRYFKEQTGTNFAEYVARKRIALAKELMKDRNLRIEDVCARVGYENALTFRRVFRKYEGMTPSEYRSS